MARHSQLPGVHLVEPSRFRPHLHYELIVCGLSGHELIGIDARELRPDDTLIAREIDDVRWHRCLRCDSWVPVDAPASPARELPPERDEIDLPPRGKPLRDKIVLRVIAVNRALHFVVLGAIAIFVFVFAEHRDALKEKVFRVIADLQTGASSGHPSKHGLGHEIERAFSLQSSTLKLVGVVFAVYAIVEGIEAFGLWYQRRWAEYLTFLVTTSLLPLEIYELATKLSPVKILTFLINLGVVAYLLFAKRLFGVRGGVAAEEREREDDCGWGALERNAPEVVAGAS
ncbi:MAG: DUF2127 domain-containing protein [Actinobacteria bacterium]|nr:DUF2127 domain-containing protein [Actinomycetota bacterium]